MAASATTPPATPPAIAAVFDEDPLPDLGEESDPETAEVAEEGDPATREAEERAVVECPAPAADVKVEAEINEPGITSGESPTLRAAVASQRPETVLSVRAQCGTRVPDGTALGNVEGAKVVVQLVLYSAQVIHIAPWHASQALRRLYETVLHLHMLEPSATLGPEYESPNGSAFMVNAPLLQVDMRYAATVHAFWPRLLNDQSHNKLQSGALI
jgi:hypothetical protein